MSSTYETDNSSSTFAPAGRQTVAADGNGGVITAAGTATVEYDFSDGEMRPETSVPAGALTSTHVSEA